MSKNETLHGSSECLQAHHQVPCKKKKKDNEMITTVYALERHSTLMMFVASLNLQNAKN